MRRVLLFLLLAPLLSSCARRLVRPEPTGEVRLGERSAPVRDWTHTPVCWVEPAGLSEDLAAWAALLEDFLEATSAGARPDAARLALLEQAQAQLPAALPATGAVLVGLEDCPGRGTLDAQARTVGQLVERARGRLAEAPALLEAARRQQAVQAWRERQPQLQEEARAAWCPARPRPGSPPEAFYAVEQPGGVREWLFCDGTRVRQASGAEPEVVPPESGERPRLPPGAYVEAAGRFPAQEVQRPPEDD